MKMSPEINNSLEIDKSKFKKFRFDQIALSISERVEPQNTDLEIYYGLEHLDSNSIHLTRNGVPSDVEGTKLRVYPGDIIFGKRRAYQRKAAICKVDAICSAHAMVLRANPKVILPKLFPFFLHSDLFMNRAIDISVGSLSPTINWGTLKEQEFSLPPLDQQEMLAELLWAGDDYHCILLDLKNKLSHLRQRMILNEIESSTHSKITLGDYIDVLSGFPFDSKLFNDQGVGHRLIRIRDLGAANSHTYFSGEYDTKYMIEKGQLIIGMDGDFPVHIWSEEPALLNQRNCKITVSDLKLNQEYLNALVSYFINIINNATGATTVKHLSVSDIRKIKFPLPDNNYQNEFIEKFQNLQATFYTLEKQLLDIKCLFSKLINNSI